MEEADIKHVVVCLKNLEETLVCYLSSSLIGLPSPSEKRIFKNQKISEVKR